MKKILSLILNLPWSVLGIILALISFPVEIKNSDRKLLALIINAKRVWLFEIFRGRRIKGITMGNVILLSDIAKETTIEHELIHLRQFTDKPFIFMFLYFIEFVKHGYKEDVYEVEARKINR